MIEKTKLPLAAFVADNATVRGHVTAGKGSSIYFGAVIRSESDTTAIGEDTGTVEEVYEPYLIMEGFIKRTQRGRMVTPLAYQHLGRPMTGSNAAEPSLFD